MLTLQLNGTDIAPNYAGTLMGLSNTIGNAAGFIAPIVTGAITHEVHMEIQEILSSVLMINFISSKLWRPGDACSSWQQACTRAATLYLSSLDQARCRIGTILRSMCQKMRNLGRKPNFKCR